jgi:hypothetical protein
MRVDMEGDSIDSDIIGLPNIPPNPHPHKTLGEKFMRVKVEGDIRESI